MWRQKNGKQRVNIILFYLYFFFIKLQLNVIYLKKIKGTLLNQLFSPMSKMKI